MITKQHDILQEMQILYQWSKTTFTTYDIALRNYTKFQEKSIDELILEAEDDEENIVKLSKRNIKHRMLQYQLHLQQQELKPNTIKLYIAMISKIYRYCDIEVPRLPPVKNTVIETFEDIPTKEEISNAIIHSRTKMKAIITFLASTGLRRSDAARITVNDFITATQTYHNNNYSSVIDLIKILERKELIIPEWHIQSKKTGINHITFSSHESTVYILQMLKERYMKQDINVEETIFGINENTITINFENLNDKLNYGFKETRRKFHPHSLRKYFATTLTGNGVDYLATQFMLGHSLNSVDSSYFFCDPLKLKNKYVRILEHLTFTMKLSYIDVTSNERRELLELRRFKKESDERIRKLEELINMIQ